MNIVRSAKGLRASIVCHLEVHIILKVLAVGSDETFVCNSASYAVQP